MTPQRSSDRQIDSSSLVDLLDRVIDGGVVLGGDILIALAGIDLIRIDLRLLLASTARLCEETERRP